MREKRSLFETIFGKKRDDNKNYSAYKLLSSWESTFIPYSGNAWDINTVRSAVDAFARRVSTAQPRHVRQTEETWGLGARALTDADFLIQFLGTDGTAEVGGNVDAITGATVTSKAITRGVNAAVGFVTGADTSSSATTWGG